MSSSWRDLYRRYVFYLPGVCRLCLLMSFAAWMCSWILLMPQCVEHRDLKSFQVPASRARVLVLRTSSALAGSSVETDAAVNPSHFISSSAAISVIVPVPPKTLEESFANIWCARCRFSTSVVGSYRFNAFA